MFITSKRFYQKLLSTGCFLLITALLPFQLFAQAKTVTGTVTGTDGLPVSGVSVQVKGSGAGTSTDSSGNFSLSVPNSSATLILSSVGYNSQNVALNGRSDVSITLSGSAAKELQQVVVVGYGTQRKVDVTGSVAHVGGDQLVKQPVVTFTQALQSKIAGVQVTSSGQPGSSPQVIIRGAGSILGGANPLYIIDGVWSDASEITNINTADILSVDVLKDASACSIYGVRGANGVILITTKQGSGKLKVTYTGNAGVQQAAYIVPMANAHQYIAYQTAITGLPFDSTAYNTNWYKQILRNAFYQTHNISASGSSEHNRYFLSVGYLTNEGIIIFNNYKRYTVRLNNEFTPTSFLKIGTTASFANQASQNVNTGIITEDAYRASPLVPAVINGKFGNTSQYQNVGNPVLDAQNTNDLSNNNTLQGNVYVEVKPVTSLAIRSTFGDELFFNNDRQYTYQHPNDTTFFNVNSGSQGASRSTLAISNSKTYHWVWSNTITYSKDFGSNKVTVLAGTEAQEYNNVGSTTSRFNVPPIQSEWYLQNGDQAFQFNGSSVNKYRTNSYFGRLFYSYNDRYQFTGNFRADASSVFAANHRWGYFPGVSAGWIISNEKFMQHQNTLSFLKLRGSWGKLGNSAVSPDGPILTVLGNLPYFFNSGTSAANPSPGSIIPQVKDINIHWETTKETDLGLEFALLSSRLTGEIDIYDKKVIDALIYVQVQGTFGSQANPNSSVTPGDVLTNAATIDNKGIEFSLRWHDNIGKNFSYFIAGNATSNRNRVVNLTAGLPLFDGNINGYYTTETKTGYPIGSFFMRKVVGVFQNQADIDNYKGKNGQPLQPGAQPGEFKYQYKPDGTLDTAYLGSYQPKLYIGFSTGFNYRSFDFSVDLYANIGNQVYNGKQQARVAARDNLERSIATSYWTAQNKSNTQPLANGGNLPASSYFIASGTFARINNITLGYTLSQKIIKGQSVLTNCRIFFNAQNPVTLKRYGGFSSELPGTSPTNAGIELSTYPTTRTFAFGVTLGI